MEQICSLSDIEVGQTAVVERLCIHGAMRRRLLDIGLCGGTRVSCVGRSPMGDPSAYLIRGAVIAIRECDGKRVIVSVIRGGGSPLMFRAFPVRDHAPSREDGKAPLAFADRKFESRGK